MISNKISTLLVFYIIAFSALGQDVTIPGSTNCGAAVSGTWTVPCDVTSVSVEVYGGGGAGGGGGGGSNGGFFGTRGGGGGGGGGFTTITINVTPGSTFSYNIGGGGCGGSNGSDGSSGGNGSAGGNSSFSGTDAGGGSVSLSANGGSGGTGGSGTNGSPGNGGAGGNSSGGTTNTTGTSGSGGSGGTGGNGGNGAGPSGGAGGVGNSGAGDPYSGGGAGGGNSPGGQGAAGAILITFITTNPMTKPVISTTPPTCTTAASSTISNYNSSFTYTFTPTGPTVGAGGAISGMTVGTSYTVVANDGGCSSPPSDPFSNASAGVPAPVISSTPASCTSAGTSTISNYDAALTYIFTPTGPTVGAGGAISGMTTGTSYTVQGSDGSCTSSASSPFSNDAQFPSPSVSISSSDADNTICNGDTVLFTANPSGFASYDFKINGASSQNGSSNTYSTSNLANGDVINVTATSNDGCVGPQSNSITFTVNPIPSVTLASSSDSICIGDNVSFTASPSGMNNYEFFNGSTSLQSGTSSSFSSTNFTAGSHNITVVATNLGCSSPASNVKTLTVISGPAVTLSSSDADNIICAGDTVTFTASPSGFANYDFYNGATLIQSGSGVTYTTSGLTSGNSITVKATNLGCPGPSSNAIVTTINAIPSSSLASNANTVCNGDNVTFTASPTGMSNYQFFVNGVSVQSGSGNTYSSTNMQNNDTVNVIVTNQGCSSTMSTAVAITVNPIPTVSLSVNPTEICDGQTAVFYASPSGYDNYQFFNNGNSIQNGTSDSLVATGLSSGNSITVIATDLGCSSPPSAPVSVIINTPPSPTITGTNIICNGDSTTLTAGNGTAYSWSNGSTTNPTTVAPTATTSYSVTVTDAKGCKGVGSITIAVIQHAGPELGPDIFVCNKQGKTLNAAIPGGVSYVWSPSAGLNSSTSPSPIANPDSTTTYFVTVTDVNGCKDTDSITVFPSAVNADAGDDVTINYGTGNPLAGSGGTQYSWSPAEGLSCTQCQNPIANPENTTTYSVTVTNDDGCVGTDKVTVTVIVTNDVFIPDAFSPNGDSQNDVLYVRGNTIKELYFAVFDRWGNKVFETTNKGSGWDGTYRGGNAEEGVYVYYLKATIVNGNLISKKGDVTLVR